MQAAVFAPFFQAVMPINSTPTSRRRTAMTTDSSISVVPLWRVSLLADFRSLILVVFLLIGVIVGPFETAVSSSCQGFIDVFGLPKEASHSAVFICTILIILTLGISQRWSGATQQIRSANCTDPMSNSNRVSFSFLYFNTGSRLVAAGSVTTGSSARETSLEGARRGRGLKLAKIAGK